MICATAFQQADGSYLLGLDPSNTNVATCQYVVQTGSELVSGSLMTMTPEDAMVISTEVVLLWSLAWSFKQVARVLKGNDDVEYE